MPRMIVFDVNETLLDLKALDPLFVEYFGDSAVRGLWFSQFIHNAFVATITGKYAPFGQIGGAALEMVAQRRGITLTPEQKQAIANGVASLPAHPDVRPALETLKAAGFRLATLTNSTQAVVEQQLANAGLRELFEAALSADEVQRLKPAPEPYQMAAQRLGVAIGQLRLVAAHAWDIAGARRAGAAAAFVARPGMVLDPLADAPDVVGSDLHEVARQIIERE